MEGFEISSGSMSKASCHKIEGYALYSFASVKTTPNNPNSLRIATKPGRISKH